MSHSSVYAPCMAVYRIRRSAHPYSHQLKHILDSCLAIVLSHVNIVPLLFNIQLKDQVGVPYRQPNYM